MMLDDYYWHYDYARLAWDTGFCFDKYKYPNLDKNKICLIDIDRIIKERDVASVERNISIVLQYVLESDQAVVLDSNFVKLFRLSQLSVEYLLFCKKYLDKTVVLLKKDISKLKQEIQELKQYTEELETHISSSRNSKTKYSCETCLRMFSSEDYLNSHVKRRHGGSGNKDNMATESTEAEKLHSEIKQLKERLNNTEKFIQEQPNPKEVDNFKEISEETEGKTVKLVSEIQESFEKFRNQVEDKMNNLQTEKNFFTDKYDKLFEVVLHYKNKEKDQIDDLKNVEKAVIEVPRIENTGTQTEEEKHENNLQIETFQHDNTYHITENCIPSKHVDNIDQKIEEKLSTFEESIESKISTGLGNIENQIQAFWQKLSEGDLSHPQPIPEVKIIDQPVQTDVPINCSTKDETKPTIKPRTKFTASEEKQVPQVNPKYDVDRALRPKSSSQPNLKPNMQSAAFVKSDTVMYNSSSDSSGSENNSTIEEPTETEKNKEDTEYSPIIVKEHQSKPKFLPSKTDHKLLPDKPQVVPSKDLSHTNQQVGKDNAEHLRIRQQLISAIDSSLQEMGISPHWNGIPQKTFERALEIVNHQAALSKKGLPNYDSLRKSIEKMLKNDKNLKESSKKINTAKNEVLPNKRKSKPKTIKIQIRKNQLPSSKSSPVVSIKNPALYDTDSENDIKPYLPKNFNQETNENRTSIHEKAHSAVIEELQSKFSQKLADTDSELNSALLSVDDNDKKEKETKSAMKTYSSEGSLVKKKVFFDVEDIDVDNNVEDEKAKSEPKLSTKQDDSLSDFEIT